MTAQVDVEVEADSEEEAVLEAILVLDSEACFTTGEISDVRVGDEPRDYRALEMV